VALVHRGRLVVYGELDEVRRRYSPHEVIVWTGSDLDALGMPARQHEVGSWRVELRPSDTASSYLEQLIRSGIVVDRYEPLVARMDEIFVRLVGEER
jgi:ABC-type uncharacterized transport system ATPase subunit